VVWREGGVSSVFLEGRLRCRKAEGPVGGPWELVGTFMPRLWLLGLSLGWLKCVLTCGLWSGDNLRGAGPVCQAAHVHRALLPRDDFNASCALSFPCASLKPDMCLSGLITSLGLFLMWAGAVKVSIVEAHWGQVSFLGCHKRAAHLISDIRRAPAICGFGGGAGLSPFQRRTTQETWNPGWHGGRLEKEPWGLQMRVNDKILPSMCEAQSWIPSTTKEKK
jgi:hypothetical protein